MEVRRITVRRKKNNNFEVRPDSSAFGSKTLLVIVASPFVVPLYVTSLG